MSDPRLCIDCRHYDPGRLPGDGFDYCRHPAAMMRRERSLVTGEIPAPRYHWPVWMRSDHMPCGPDAKLFEPKPKGFV